MALSETATDEGAGVETGMLVLSFLSRPTYYSDWRDAVRSPKCPLVVHPTSTQPVSNQRVCAVKTASAAMRSANTVARPLTLRV